MLTIIGLTIFLLLFWNIVFNEAEISYSILEYEIVIVGIVFTTHLYKKYYNSYFVKRVTKGRREYNLLKFNLFGIVMIQLLVLFFVYIIIFFTLAYFPILNEYNIVGTYSKIDFAALKENLVMILVLAYYALLTSIVVVSLAYFLNHFIKSASNVFGILIIIFLYTMLFGSIFMPYYILPENIDGDWIMYFYNPKEITPKIIIGFIITPWTQISIVSRDLFLIKETYVMSFFDWFNYSNLGFWSILLWTPYLTIAIFSLFPSIIERILKIVN